MSFLLRPASPEEFDTLTELCLRSKAHWGYDADFMAACRDELTLTSTDHLIVAEREGQIVGMAQLERLGDDADLDALFVDPPYIGTGAGRVLYDWCMKEARRMGANRLRIDADPDALPFYQRMGAVQIGSSPSGSIPGRVLPQLEHRLR